MPLLFYVVSPWMEDRIILGYENELYPSWDTGGKWESTWVNRVFPGGSGRDIDN